MPNLRPKKVEGLAVSAGAVYQTAIVTGYDGRGWVVRSALTGAAGAELAASDALVQLLRRRVTFELPKLAGSARPKTGPAVAVYERLRGHALDWTQLRGRTDAARAVGEALAVLHGVDPRVVEEAGMPSYDTKEYRDRLLSDLDRAAATQHVPASLLNRWEEALQADELWHFSTTVTHGPLHGEDVYVDEGDVSGVAGWEHAGVADPARDFSLLWQQAPRQAFDTVFEAYAGARRDRPDRNIERRIHLMGEMELAYALLQSTTLGNDRLIEFHAAALNTLAHQVEDDASLIPPKRRGGIAPMEVDAIDPSEIESVGSDDLEAESETTVEIPVRPVAASAAEGGAARVQSRLPHTERGHGADAGGGSSVVATHTDEGTQHDDSADGHGGSTRVDGR